MKRLLTGLLACVLTLLCASASAQDYARERRWAQEIVPDVVVGDAVYLRQANRHEFLGLYVSVKNANAAVLLVHGRSVQPNFGIIGVLRVALADMGYTTLAIQMPVLAASVKSSEYYPKVFPDALERIRIGARWLRARGYSKVVLLSHGLGSWMANVYFNETRHTPFAAWVCLGRTGTFGPLKYVKAPVLDVYGQRDLPSVLRTVAVRRAELSHIPGSAQVMIHGTGHFYTGKESELAAVIGRFIDREVVK